MAAMPPRSVVRVYGNLSNAPCQVDANDVVFHGKKLEGFTMYEWLETTSMLRQFLSVLKVQGLLGGVLRTQVKARLGLAECRRAMALSLESASDGKVLFVPSAVG
jgi:NADPH:quinone reductase